jgi:hypothetical protein
VRVGLNHNLGSPKLNARNSLDTIWFGWEWDGKEFNICVLMQNKDHSPRLKCLDGSHVP